MKERVHLSIHGRVQMVGFRFFAQRTASGFGVSGWVRNCPDGSVEVFAEGDRNALDQFISRMKSGPPAAEIVRVDLQWDPDIPGGLSSFSIR